MLGSSLACMQAYVNEHGRKFCKVSLENSLAWKMTNGKVKSAGAVIAKLRSRTSLYTCVDEIIIPDVNYTKWLSVL